VAGRGIVEGAERVRPGDEPEDGGTGDHGEERGELHVVQSGRRGRRSLDGMLLSMAEGTNATRSPTVRRHWDRKERL
jgi:hypothetical protein